jgi:hypothetical protein
MISSVFASTRIRRPIYISARTTHPIRSAFATQRAFFCDTYAKINMAISNIIANFVSNY